MTRIWLPSLALFLGAGLFVLAQDDDTRERVQELIERLSSTDFDDRESATRELMKIGKPALEQLRKAAASKDPEVRARAESVIKHIESVPKEKKPERRRQGSSTVVTSDNEGTTYTITPLGEDPITFRKNKDESVKLTADGKSYESKSLKAFLKDHKKIAEAYGISEKGIDYAGARVSFSRIFRLPRDFDRENPFGDMEERVRKMMERLRKQNRELDEMFRRRLKLAAFSPVPDVLRAHLDIPEGEGVVVDWVGPESRLKKHDILLSVNGKAVRNRLDASGIGDKDTVTLIRGGKRMTITPKKSEKDY